MVWRITTGGLFLVSERGQNYAQPWCLCKLPHRDGQTWETRFRHEGHPSESVGKMTAGPIEKVRVPAGEFSAARVEWELDGAKLAPYWYAHGVGLVRLGDLMKLRSFTPGTD
jgi:hypothetical protein